MHQLCWSLLLALFACSSLFSQSIFLTGRLTDSSGEALPGANIIYRGDPVEVTDAAGEYEFVLPQVGSATQTITFSYLAFQNKVVQISAGPRIGSTPAEVQVQIDNQPPQRLPLLRQTEDGFYYRLDLTMEEKPYLVKELTITQTRADQLTPVTYVELKADEIQANNLGQDVPYQLKWTPSVVVNSDGGTGTGYTGIWIRGSDPTRINVTLNGIPLNDAESQGVFWVNTPDFSASADNIQIQRGVGTSANGAGAFGAGIDIVTNQLKEEPYATLELGGGSFDTRRASVRLGTGLLKGGFTLDGRLSTIQSDGFIDRASVDQDAWYLGGGWIGDRSVLRFNAFSGHEITYQAWNGVPLSELEAGNRTFNSAGDERPGSPHPDEVDNYRQTHYQLHYSSQLTDLWKLKLSGHYTQGKGYFEQYKADEDLADYNITAPEINGQSIDNSDLIRRRWLDNDFYGLVYSLSHGQADSPRQWILGGAANHYTGDHFGEVIWARFAGDSETDSRYYDNQATKTDLNIYGRLNQQLGKGWRAYVDLQLRRVDYEFLGLDDDLSRAQLQRDYTFFNPKVGINYLRPDGLRAYLSFGVAQREPNRNDHTDNPINQLPSPEKLYNTELGLERTAARANWGVNLYHMAYRDQLVLTGRLNDVGEYIRTNVPDSYRLGLELIGGYQLNRYFSVGGNLTLSRNRIANYTEYIDQYDDNFDWLGQTTIERKDQPLAFSPDIQGALELSYRQKLGGDTELEATLMNKLIGRRYLDNSGDEANSLDPYSYSDLRLGLAFPVGPIKQLRLTLLARNLFDAQYESNGWSYRYIYAGDQALDQGFYPQAGRNFLLRLGLDL